MFHDVRSNKGVLSKAITSLKTEVFSVEKGGRADANKTVVILTTSPKNENVRIQDAVRPLHSDDK